MTSKEFIDRFEETLELEAGSITKDQQLSELGSWDSLAIMALLAMVDEQTGVTLPGSKIAKANTVQDLILLLEEKISG